MPIRLCGTLPVMKTIGVESMYAVAIGVTRFVAPGPLVAMRTPVLPLARVAVRRVTGGCSWAVSMPIRSCRLYSSS